MTSNPIQLLVNAAVAKAEEHAQLCAGLFASDGLTAALDHCRSVGLTPPACSLTTESPNAARLRSEAARKLSDPKWWAKNLEHKAIQDFENEQRMQGKVTNFVSDALMDYRGRRK